MAGDRRDPRDRDRDRDRRAIRPRETPAKRPRETSAQRRTEREDRRDRMDQPQRRRPRMTLPNPDSESFGRLSERIARFLGTGRFLVWMTFVIMLWVLWNIAAPHSWRFDEYPFIFLTLVLSLQASYAAPLILLAQNRQDDRDKVNMEQDRARGERTVADTEYLTREVAALRQALGEVATRDFLRSELQSLLKELDQRPYAEALEGERTARL
jgi:uncharacterized membrane protein